MIGAIGHNGGGATTPGAGFTELAETTGNRNLETQYRLTGASATVAWTLFSAVATEMVAIEVTD